MPPPAAALHPFPGTPKAGHRPLGDTISQRVGLGEGQPEAAAGQARTRTQTLTPWQLPCPSGCRSRAWWVPSGQPRSKTKQHPVEHKACPVEAPDRRCPNPNPPGVSQPSGSSQAPGALRPDLRIPRPHPSLRPAPPIAPMRTQILRRHLGLARRQQAGRHRTARGSLALHSLTLGCPLPPSPQAPESREGANTS